ncbi:acetoin utilization deacetylase AcuC-like enzyme [Deinococcus metalli]|uniref:Acetoin utilization deacetylase AcuC-like enzyme n=1 Tax=Deinococcus metalli TaxID=1141878 RepID=A0A7W8KC71_9DEIO|nr:histone deacetylase [Deinococcus metalli]MBB5375490.1 acetoin utilization deacetylase AcuC-like enzyme [Deinococcus metalli]GHF28882.1 histone deacetylase [Deinococcus metalli]
MPAGPHPYRAFTPLRRAVHAAGPAPRRQFLPREFIGLLLEGAAARLPLLDAPDLAWADAERVHDPAYLRRWRDGHVTREEERALGFAWSPAVVERSVGSSGATLAATREALTLGLGLNLGGGTHHAYADHAEGFSFLNDVAIGARWLLDHGHARRILILDLDVHQGNGTAHIFRDEPRVLTVSVHAANNYPFRKETGDLDVPLPDGTEDGAYLAALDARVAPAVAAFRPDFAYYLAGADVLAGDQLGKLALTLDGLRARDDRVYRWAARAGVPLVTVMAGGYHRDPATLIAARLGTLDAALAAYVEPQARREG